MRALFLILGFILVGCAGHSEKRATAQEKMTPPTKDENAMRLGIHILMEGLSDADGLKTAKEFEAQLPVFEPCLEKAGKTRIVRLKAKFELSRRGLITKTKVLEVVPEVPEFAQCFTKQVEQVDLGRQKKAVQGELILGTFYGQPEGWGIDYKKRQ